jgi:hypothetical protein
MITILTLVLIETIFSEQYDITLLSPVLVLFNLMECKT